LVKKFRKKRIKKQRESTAKSLAALSA